MMKKSMQMLSLSLLVPSLILADSNSWTPSTRDIAHSVSGLGLGAVQAVASGWVTWCPTRIKETSATPAASATPAPATAAPTTAAATPAPAAAAPQDDSTFLGRRSEGTRKELINFGLGSIAGQLHDRNGGYVNTIINEVDTDVTGRDRAMRSIGQMLGYYAMNAAHHKEANWKGYFRLAHFGFAVNPMDIPAGVKWAYNKVANYNWSAAAAEAEGKLCQTICTDDTNKKK